MNFDFERFEKFAGFAGFPEAKVSPVTDLVGGGFSAVGVHLQSGDVEILQVSEEPKLRSPRLGELDPSDWDLFGLPSGTSPMLFMLLKAWILVSVEQGAESVS